MTTTQAVIKATRYWIQDTVIGLNLCPFAHRPFDQDAISYRVSRAASAEAVYADLLYALDGFLSADARDEATGLFICPDCFSDFLHFNAYLDVVDQVLVDAELEGVVQIASFHPQYRFADVHEQDPAHFTNRSPYPMFHFIREEQLADALEHYPDPASIPNRNIALLREMGWDVMARRLQQAVLAGGT